MKLSKLGALIKDQKGAEVLDTVDVNGQIVRQHIMLNGAMYPLDGYPQLDKDILLTILDVPKEKRNDYWYKEERHSDCTMQWAEDNPRQSDTPASLCETHIKLPAQELIPVNTHSGMVFIDEAYKKPIDDETGVDYWCRRMENGTVIVAKRGYQLIAAIAAPTHWATEDVADDLHDIANAAWALREARKMKETNAEQQRM